MRSFFLYILLLVIGFPLLQAQSLDHWLEVGLENSPSVRTQEAKIKAAEQAYATAYEWPETHIEVSAIEWMPNDWSPYFRPTVSLSQDLPWFGTQKIKKELVAAAVHSQQAETQLIEADLIQKISNQYVELQFLNEKKGLLVAYLEKLESIQENLLFKLESGQASAWEAMLLENELREAKAEIQKIHHQMDRTEDLFFLLVDSDKGNLHLDKMEFTPTQTQLEIGNHPALAGLEAQKLELETSKKQLKLDYAPKLSVGIHYEAAMPVEPTYVTHDMIMPSIGMSLPLWTNRKKAKENQIDYQQEVLEAESLERKNLLQQELNRTQNQLFDRQTDYEILEESIANTEEVINLLWSEYEANKVNYQEISRIQTQLIEKKIAQLESLKSYQQLKIYLQYLLTNTTENQ